MRRYMILAGEPSGDLLGADFMAAMTDLAPTLQSIAVGGDAMRQHASIMFEDIRSLSVMGFSAVIQHLAAIREYASRVLALVDRYQPSFVVLIDYPGLHVYLAEQIKLRQIPVVQFVAPQLWAWHASRAYRWQKAIDLLLVILPFEVPFFAKYDIKAEYVGTPQVDRVVRGRLSPELFGFATREPVIGLFPGSRRSELQRILPAMLEARSRLIENGYTGQFAISLAPTIDLEVVSELLLARGHGSLGAWPQLEDTCTPCYRIDPQSTLVHGQSLKLMAAVDAAAVTSGTATLECALTQTPMCVVYRTSPINFWLAKRLVTVENIGLVNLVAETMLAREFIQDFDPGELGLELQRLATDQPYRTSLINKLGSLNQKLSGQVGRRAAQATLDYLSTRAAPKFL